MEAVSRPESERRVSGDVLVQPSTARNKLARPAAGGRSGKRQLMLVRGHLRGVMTPATISPPGPYLHDI